MSYGKESCAWDLNMDWEDEEEEIVPSTQYSELNPIDSLRSPSTPQVYPTSPPKTSPSARPTLCAIRTPLSSITNHTPNPATSGKKVAKQRVSKKSSKAVDVASNPSALSQPTPLNTGEKPRLRDGDKPVSPNLFFRSGHWTLKETVTMLDGRSKLLEEMKGGHVGALLKTQDERWEYVSKYCVQRGVLRSADQCLFRWDRILAAFKKVHDYERHIPSGGDSYWTMSGSQREEMKLPRNFTEDVYSAMLDRIGSDRLINPGNIVYDTSKDILGDSSPLREKVPNANEEEMMVEEGSTGKKRKRGDRLFILKQELESTTKKLISFMEGIESKKTKHDDDVLELTKAEFEESVALNRKRIALEEESNEALKQIAEYFKCFAMHASPPNMGKSIV